MAEKVLCEWILTTGTKFRFVRVLYDNAEDVRLRRKRFDSDAWVEVDGREHAFTLGNEILRLSAELAERSKAVDLLTSLLASKDRTIQGMHAGHESTKARARAEALREMLERVEMVPAYITDDSAWKGQGALLVATGAKVVVEMIRKRLREVEAEGEQDG